MIKQNSTIKNFWILFFAMVALIAVLSAIYAGFAASRKISLMKMSVVDDENSYKISQENTYKQALYAACDSMKNLDADIGKASVSSNAGNQAQMLTSVIIHANLVNQNLAKLPIDESENLEACQKFVNQTQDYATYLLKKLSNGEKLSVEEKTALANLDNVAAQLYDFLETYAESDSGMFMTNGNGSNNSGALSESMDDIDEDMFEYEKLIYDGPFSDSAEEKTMVTENEKNPEDVSATLAEIFGENKYLQTINSKGKWYCFETDNGRIITAADGRVAQFESYNTEYSDEEYDEEISANAEPTSDNVNQISVAENFCRQLGYNVRGIWISKPIESTTYVNCATVSDDVIIYPELIKVAISNGEVVGIEAKAYLLNHRERDINFGEISQDEAQSNIDGSLTVTNVAKALVEKSNKCYFCYEFQCNVGDRQYYVYIDSETGDEVEIFKVVENTEGFTVI